MSLLKAIKAQLGLSNTPANNFTITAEADNGTLKLARGNAGATTQDILTVDASGNVLVDGNNLNLFSAKSLASSGYQKLPSGLIIQWGQTSWPSGGDKTITLPIAFPTALLSVTASEGSTGSNITTANILCTSKISASQFRISSSTIGSAMWIACGY